MSRPKHQVVRDYIQNSIDSGHFVPGDQLPTDDELSERLSVSRPTIARAMRDLEQLGLIRRRVGAGTFVEAKSSESEQRLGLLIPELGNTEIFEPVCAEIARTAQPFGYSLQWGDAGVIDNSDAKEGRLAVSAERAERACKSFIDEGVTGVFFVPMVSTRQDEDADRRILDRLDAAGIAVVLLDRDVSQFPERSLYDLVTVNHLSGQIKLCEHLLKSGRKRIAYLQWPGTSDSMEQRLAGYQLALVRAGHIYNPEWVHQGDARDREFIERILSDHSPDAFTCENDVVAAHLMQTLSTLGVRVPDEIAVVGFDDVKYAQLLAVPLTTIRQPCSQLGEVAVRLMNSRISAPHMPARTVQLESELIVRKSCGVAAKEAPVISREIR